MRVLLLLIVTACTPAAPHWSDARTDLDRVPLSVWSSGSQRFFSGGPLGSAGQGLFLRHDGAWHEVPTGGSSTLWWVFGFSNQDVWTVGEGGTVLRWNGSELVPEPVPTSATLFGVWGVSDDDLWVVGGVPDASGVILHRSGGSWSEVTGPGNTGAYFKVWGSAADDVYVCGQSGTILHWDGTSFHAEATGLSPAVSLFTVAGRSRDDVYAVGGLGNAVALHRSGGAWLPVDDKLLAEAPDLAGIAVASDGSVVMVGQSGGKLRGMPGALADESAQATRADFHAAAFDGDGQVWAVGGNWIAPPGSARHGVIVRYGN